jgi:cytochrome P450
MKQSSNYRIDWTTFNASKLFSRIMQRTTTRILVGPEFARDERFITSSLATNEGIFLNAILVVLLTVFPFSLGPLGGLGSWVGTRLSGHLRQLDRTTKMLRPVIKQRLRDWDKRDKVDLSDGISWTIEETREAGIKIDVLRVAHQVTHNLWAGSSAPSSLVTQLVFQTLQHPEYIAPLREEIKQLVDEYGWSERTLNEMVKVDSFIRECNRLFPAGCGMLIGC